MIKPKTLKYICATILISLPIFAWAQTVDPAFNASQLIPDATFADTQTFGGPPGIQKFLQDKGSVLANTSPDFLVSLKEPYAVLLKQGLDDPDPNLGRLRTAAELIWDASVSSGLNPQVIIVTLEKEQSLIDGQFTAGAGLQKALDHAMGFACPDSTGCGNLFPGFYYQLFGNYDSSGNRYLGAAKSLMKSFSTVGGRGPNSSHTGDVITLDNTMGNYDNIQAQQTVTLANNATAALYRYTPHVFNGNYNFWKFFTEWFRYPNGTLLKTAASTDTYIIQNGLKALVPAFVAQARGLNLSSAITISPTEFAGYDTDAQPLGPTDNTVVQIAGQGPKYVFIQNVRHQASDLVIKQRGLDPNLVLTISAQDAAIFGAGSVLPPKDGTIIRGTSPAVYLTVNGQIKLFSAFTFKQAKVKPSQIVSVPDAEIATYAQNGFVPPQNGSLVKTANNPAIYLVQDGFKHAVIADIFRNQAYRQANVGTITSDEMNALVIGSYAPPKDGTFYAVDSKKGPLFEFKQGTAHPISSYVAKQRGITPDYVFTNAVAVEWYTGIPVPPRDGTLLKGDSDSAVYLVLKGQLSPLSAAQFAAGHYSFKKVITLPQAEVSSYATVNAVTQ